MAKKKYPGALGKPLPQPSILQEFTGQSVDQYILGKQQEALNELFRHYGIAPDQLLRFELLAMALAFDHVPAFTTAWHDQIKQRGRPRTGSDFAVYAAVETRHLERPELSISAICLGLAQKRGTEFYRPTGTSPEKHAKALERRYYRHRERLGTPA